MPNIDLFTWWTICISFSIIFLTLVSIYVYISGKSRSKKDSKATVKRTSKADLIKEFSFVWVLLGLLVFYILSIQLGAGIMSEVVFALGNVVVEVLLILYLLRNREKTPDGK